MSVTLVETNPVSKKYTSTIAIRPYVDSTKSNMGLEKYELALFGGEWYQALCHRSE
jgi:hypothetical protein